MYIIINIDNTPWYWFTPNLRHVFFLLFSALIGNPLPEVYVDSHSNFTVIGTSDYVIQTGHNFTIECHGTYPPVLKVVRRNKVQVSKSFYTAIMWFWAFCTAIMWFWAFYTVIMWFWAFYTAIMEFWAFCKLQSCDFSAFYTVIMWFWAILYCNHMIFQHFIL